MTTDGNTKYCQSQSGSTTSRSTSLRSKIMRRLSRNCGNYDSSGDGEKKFANLPPKDETTMKQKRKKHRSKKAFLKRRSSVGSMSEDEEFVAAIIKRTTAATGGGADRSFSLPSAAPIRRRRSSLLGGGLKKKDSIRLMKHKFPESDYVPRSDAKVVAELRICQRRLGERKGVEEKLSEEKANHLTRHHSDDEAKVNNQGNARGAAEAAVQRRRRSSLLGGTKKKDSFRLMKEKYADSEYIPGFSISVPLDEPNYRWVAEHGRHE